MNPRHFWLSLYLVANVYAIGYTLMTGEFVGDLDGIQFSNDTAVVVAGIAVLLSYIGLLTFGFDCLYRRFKVDDGPAADTKGQGLTGLIVAGAQVLFFLFNITFDIGRAGSTAHVSFALYFVWILIPIDAIAPIYCAQAPSSRLRVINVAIFVISNLARGWSGPLLLVFSIEWVRAYRSGASRLSRFAFPALIPLGLVLYPIILAAKFYLRAANDASIGSFMEMLGDLPSPTSGDYVLLLQTGIHQLMGRLQLTSNVADLWAHAREIQAAFQHRLFFPFWLEGQHGYVVNKLMGDQVDSIGVYFTNIGDFPPRELSPDLSDSIWNTNTGWVGWFVVAPHLIPSYLLYTFIICYVSVCLMVKTSRSKVSRDFLWIVWLLYLLPGWLGTFTGFIYAQFVFLAIRRIGERMAAKRRIRLNPALAAPLSPTWTSKTC